MDPSDLKVDPLHDQIIVRQIEAEAKTEGGIIIPDSAQEKPAEGEVLAVGPGKMLECGRRDAIDVQVGDRVFFGKYAGSTVTIDGDDVLFVRYGDVIGIRRG